MKSACVAKAQSGGKRQQGRGEEAQPSHTAVGSLPALLRRTEPLDELKAVTWFRPLASNSHLNQLQSRETALIGAYMHLNSSFVTKTQNQGLFSAAFPAPTQLHSSAAPSPRHHKMAATSACHRPGTTGGSGPAPQGRFPASRPPQHSPVSPAGGFTSGVPREGLPPSSSAAAGLFICPSVIHAGRCGRSRHSWRLSGRLTLKKKSHVSADEGSKYLMRSGR